MPDRLTEDYCYKCGGCTSICPVSGSGFKPHKFIAEVALGIGSGAEVWRCLTCRECMEVCPQGVNIPEVVRSERVNDLAVPVAHKGIFQSL
ncbi:MAG TPA: 4Fe-4S dicluster domain-containing protein, partial [Halobacteria archaeon]|nr:4Fe-4S dicluster domain-containing protein [Halobacteria archaeon]